LDFNEQWEELGIRLVKKLNFIPHKFIKKSTGCVTN